MRVSRQRRRPKSSGELHDAGEHRPGDRLGQVVERRELLGADLEVGLKAGVAGLDHHVLVADDELVGALDVELVRAAAQATHRLVEREVARLRRHVLEREIGDVERLENAGHDEIGVELVSSPPSLGEEVDELTLHLAQAVAAEDQRIGVEFQVEPRELRRVVLVGDLLDHLHRERRRGEVAIDQEELLLGADPANAGFDRAVLQHQLERLEVSQELPGEGAQRFRVQLFDVVFAHRRGLSLGMPTDCQSSSERFQPGRSRALAGRDELLDAVELEAAATDPAAQLATRTGGAVKAWWTTAPSRASRVPMTSWSDSGMPSFLSFHTRSSSVRRLRA